MDGRRYKVASVGTTPDTTAAKVTLTESYAGGMIYEECTGCVTAIAATALTVSRSVTVKVGEGFMVQGYTDINQVFTAKTANTPGPRRQRPRHHPQQGRHERLPSRAPRRGRHQPDQEPVQGPQRHGLQALRGHRGCRRHHLPVRLPVLQPWRLRLLHWRVQVLQGLQQRQLRHPEHARRLNRRGALLWPFGSLSGYK